MAVDELKPVRSLGDVEEAKSTETTDQEYNCNESELFTEDYELMEKQIFDPRGPIVNHWSKLLLGACLVSLFVDPLFFYAPRVREAGSCIEESISLKLFLTIIRSLVDAFYIVQLYVRFRTAYVAPTSRVLGTGELVTDPKKIASWYIGKAFWFDLMAALPLPQVLVWMAFPNLGRKQSIQFKHSIRLIIIFQYLLRLYVTYLLSLEIIETTGSIMEKAWPGAAFNLMLYMLASHVTGSCWYLLSIERQEACWIVVCSQQSKYCHYGFPDCNSVVDSRTATWFNSTYMSVFCDPQSGLYEFGIYGEALVSGITKSDFFKKFLYSFWWGVRQLSSLGQGLEVSLYVGEISFALVIGILGLVLFALLISNMQMYLESTTKRIEEWRTKRADAEAWMHHRQLPPELKQRVRRYHHYIWVATGGFDEEQLLKGLPKDLRHDIKHYLYSDLVRRVPLFDQMDDHMLDAICEKLKNVLHIRGSCLLSEGAPVNEMIFIIRGRLESYTTNGGRSGFFNTCCIGPGDFCGEELLSWAMVPHPNVILPSSTRTVKCISEVEALALTADDLKLVASQYRRLHWKQLRPTFRFSSQQWRTWAACFIQASWRSYRRRRSSSDFTNSLPDLSPIRAYSGLKRSAKRAMSFRMDRRGRGLLYGDSDNFAASRKPIRQHFLLDVND